MQTLRSFTSAQQRQVNKAVRITSLKAEIIVVNSKNEWHQAPIVCVVASTGLHGDQGDDQALVLVESRVERGREGGREKGGRSKGTS